MIRITYIDLGDFKCVAHGGTVLSSWEPGKPVSGSDIIGIYGPNGSGKTAIVEAFGIVQRLVTGGSLNKHDAECIAIDSDYATITLHGVSCDEEGLTLYSFIYSISLWSKVKDGFNASDDDLHVAEEKLAVKDYRAEKPRLKTLFWRTTTSDSERPLAPGSHWNPLLMLDERVKSGLQLAQELAVKTHTSLLFSLPMREVMADMRKTASEQADALSVSAKTAIAEVLEPLDQITQEIAAFASDRLVIVGSSGWASGAGNRLRIPVLAGNSNSGGAEPAVIELDPSQPTSIARGECELLKASIDSLNPALGSLIPGLSLGVRELGAAVASDGGETVAIELMSLRGATAIPLRCESEGTKRLVSLLPLLVDVCNNRDACVIIDNLDRSAFELLLGKVIRALHERGRGQLVFTAHDLCPLEVLSSRQLVFTTTNPHNRYTRFRGDRENTNLRNGYLRALAFGGQPEELCDPPSADDIAAAFEDAAGTMR